MAHVRLRGDSVTTMYGTIVCGFTETPEARAAAQLAAALAGRLGLRLVLVHVSFRHGAERAIGDLASELGEHVEAPVGSGRRARRGPRRPRQPGPWARRGGGRRGCGRYRPRFAPPSRARAAALLHART